MRVKASEGGVRGRGRRTGYGVVGSHLRALEGGALARAHHAAQQLRTHQLRAPRQVPALRPPPLSATAAAAAAASLSATAAAAVARRATVITLS